MSEGKLEEVDEAVVPGTSFELAVPIEAQFLLPRGDGKAQRGGMHFGRWRKCSGGQGEEFFDPGVELRGGREQSIIAAAGLSGDAIRDFALDENHDCFKVFGIVEQPQEDLRSDVVGKIADDLRRLGAEFDAGPAQAGLGSKQRIEINGENVAFDDFNIGEHAEAEAKLCGQHAVKLNRDQAASALGQERCENAASGTDFEHRVLRYIAEGVDELLSKAVADEEMLSQLGLMLRTARGHDLRHVDPLFPGHIDCLCPETYSIITCAREKRVSREGFMHIAFVASEGVPFSKTGGLADVVGALPRALAALGHQVSVYLPRYRQTKLADPATVVRSITIPFDDKYRFASVVTGGSQSGVKFYFVDYPDYFDRDALYGTPAGDYPDNAERFALFSRAVLEATKILGVPQIFHCHDWQSALVPVLLRTVYAEDPAFRDVGTVFTIHNIGYQGLFPPETLPLLMLPWDLFTMSKMEFFGQVNFLKGALTFSDFITTVSRKYSQEIQTAEYGFGLEGVLRDRAATVTGILNGVDYDEWSPQADKFIAAKYSPQDLSGKAQCKQDLLTAFGVKNADPKIPVIGIVSRFAAQKGFDLIAQIMDRLAREEMIVVALGAGDKQYEEMFVRLNKQFPNKIAVKVAYDNAIAHKIEAGSDMFLMPSKYEPCGLNQIYSLKYGTVPIVRATGGLDDTIEPWDARSGKGTGFKFTEYNGESLLLTIKHALQAYRDQTSWQVLMRNGMNKDFSWNASAREYGKIYERVKQMRGVAPVQEKVLV